MPPEIRSSASNGGWIVRVGADWWATILGLAITGLAVPRCPAEDSVVIA